jgi:hypothetical protein
MTVFICTYLTVFFTQEKSAERLTPVETHAPSIATAFLQEISSLLLISRSHAQR